MGNRCLKLVCRLFFLPTLCLISSCGPIIQYTTIMDTPIAERPVDAKIRVYTTKVPRCQYEEVGTVRASNGLVFGGASTYVKAMKKKAREVGGDAILLGRVESLSELELELAELEEDDVQIQKGIIIRFIDRGCVE